MGGKEGTATVQYTLLKRIGGKENEGSGKDHSRVTLWVGWSPTDTCWTTKKKNLEKEQEVKEFDVEIG